MAAGWQDVGRTNVVDISDQHALAPVTSSLDSRGTHLSNVQFKCFTPLPVLCWRMGSRNNNPWEREFLCVVAGQTAASQNMWKIDYLLFCFYIFYYYVNVQHDQCPTVIIFYISTTQCLQRFKKNNRDVTETYFKHLLWWDTEGEGPGLAHHAAPALLGVRGLGPHPLQDPGGQAGVVHQPPAGGRQVAEEQQGVARDGGEVKLQRVPGLACRHRAVRTEVITQLSLLIFLATLLALLNWWNAFFTTDDFKQFKVNVCWTFGPCNRHVWNCWGRGQSMGRGHCLARGQCWGRGQC